MKRLPFPVLFSILLLFLSAFVYLKNLDNWFLWQDEANAALLAKNTLKFGLPFVHDGKNLIWPNTSDVSPESHYWILWGWFPIYANALIFKILGIGTFSARLFSALWAILFLQLSHWSLRRIFPEKGVAETAVLILLFCIPLSLFFRQCGYYAPASTLPFGMYLLLFHAPPESSLRRWAFFVLSLALVNTHVLIWGLTLALLGLLTLIRSEGKTASLQILCLSGFLALPFLALYEVWVLFERAPHSDSAGFYDYVIRARYYLYAFHDAIFPAWYALFLAFLGWRIRKHFTEREKQTLRDLFIVIGLGLLAIPLLTRYCFFRYFLFVIPFTALAVSLVQVRVLKFDRRLGILTLPLLILHFGLGFRTNQGNPAFLTQHFFNELTHDGEDLNEVLCNYLNAHAKPDQTVFCAYGDFPLQFYTALKVRGGPGATGIKPDKTFPDWGIELMDTPDWIVMREPWRFIYGDSFFEELFKHAHYEKIVLPVEDTPWGNRADPFYHFYSTPPVEHPLAIYRRTEGAASK